MTKIDTELFADERIGWTVQRVLGGLVALALVVFWVWAFSPWAPNDKADAISDKTFLANVNASCGRMQDALDALPPAADATSAAVRADVVAQSAPIFATMISEIKTSASTLSGRDAELANQWIADWESYARDRAAYADALRTNERAEFIVTRRETGQITVTMDGFTRVNDLSHCLVPGDV